MLYSLPCLWHSRHRCYLYSMVVFHVHNATLSEMSRWGISDGIFDFVGYLVEIKWKAKIGRWDFARTGYHILLFAISLASYLRQCERIRSVLSGITDPMKSTETVMSWTWTLLVNVFFMVESCLIQFNSTASAWLADCLELDGKQQI